MGAWQEIKKAMSNPHPNKVARGPGRPKGAKNLTSQRAKLMVLEALDQRGGLKWLAGLDDDVFAGLLKTILPREEKVEWSGAGAGIQIVVQLPGDVLSGEPKKATS